MFPHLNDQKEIKNCDPCLDMRQPEVMKKASNPESIQKFKQNNIFQVTYLLLPWLTPYVLRKYIWHSRSWPVELIKDRNRVLLWASSKLILWIEGTLSGWSTAEKLLELNPSLD